MFDIMRFQFRQLLRTRVVHLANLLMLTVFFLMLFLDSGNSGNERQTLTDYLPLTMNLLTGISVTAAAIMIGMVCGDDFADKTINHELAAGRSRASSFFGRAVPVLIAAPLTVVFICAVPYVLYGALFGVGNAIPVSAIVQRFLLMLLPLLRFSAFCILTVFVTKHQLAAIGASFLTMMISLSAAMGSPQFITHILRLHPCMLSLSNITELSAFSSWRTYDLTLQNFYTYYPELSVSFIVTTVIVSLTMTAVYLLLGYHFFHTDDMN